MQPRFDRAKVRHWLECSQLRQHVPEAVALQPIVPVKWPLKEALYGFFVDHAKLSAIALPYVFLLFLSYRQVHENNSKKLDVLCHYDTKCYIHLNEQNCPPQYKISVDHLSGAIRHSKEFLSTTP